MLELAELTEVLPLKGVQLSADANYHSEQNLIACERAQVDAYIPDVHFRLRDPRFADQERHKEQERTKKGAWGLEQFTYEPKSDSFICPQARPCRCTRGNIAPAEGIGIAVIARIQPMPVMTVRCARSALPEAADASRFF